MTRISLLESKLQAATHPCDRGELRYQLKRENEKMKIYEA